MGAPKPAAGYPSRTAAVLAMQAQGATDVEIGAALGIPRSTVAALARSGRRRKRRQRPAEAHGRTVVFPRDVLDQLEPTAELRGISVNELARRIVEAVVDDRLVGAVLDDEQCAS